MPRRMVSPRSASPSRRAATVARVTESPIPHLSSEPISASTALGDLARSAAAGDRDAMERLLLEAQAVAWRFSRAVCGHEEDAEDAMQEALVRTFRFVSRLRDAEAFRPWLYRTVRNACLMSRRRRVDEPRHLLSLDELLPRPDAARRREAPDVGKNPEEVVINTTLRRRLVTALAGLPPAFRMVVFLREMEGLSTRETALVVGASEDTVKARLHRARLFLQRELAGAIPRRSPRERARRSGRGRRRG
jgi:RNA polymerase sigma-70 factor, ECF subfamily